MGMVVRLQAEARDGCFPFTLQIVPDPTEVTTPWVPGLEQAEREANLILSFNMYSGLQLHDVTLRLIHHTCTFTFTTGSNGRVGFDAVG
jgi:hypothetical protein